MHYACSNCKHQGGICEMLAGFPPFLLPPRTSSCRDDPRFASPHPARLPCCWPHVCAALWGEGGAALRRGGFFVFRQCLTCLTFQPLGGKAERGASFGAWRAHPRPLLVGEKSAPPDPPSRGRAGGKMRRKSLASARRERRPIPPFRPGCARFPWPGTRSGRRGKAGLRAALRPATRPSQSWR